MLRAPMQCPESKCPSTTRESVHATTYRSTTVHAATQVLIAGRPVPATSARGSVCRTAVDSQKTAGCGTQVRRRQLRTDSLPPRLDRDHRELGRVVIDPNIDEAIVGSHAVRNRLADGVAGKVMNVDEFRLILRLPLTSAVLEISTNSFFLVSTEMSGMPRSMQSLAFAAMCSNCGFRSGCCLPSTVFFGA